MGGKSSPAPPDYKGAAEAQAGASKEITEQQTWANRPDQYTPFGNTTWDQYQEYDPVTGQTLNKWNQRTELDPLTQEALTEQQKLQLNKSQLAGSMTDRMWDEYGQPMDYSGLPGYAETPEVTRGEQLNQYGVDTSGLQQGGQDVESAEAARNRAEAAIYDRSASRLDPQWERSRQDKESRLMAQGLRPGDEAYDRAMNEMDMAKTDAYQQANYGAIVGGGEEASRTQGLDLARGQYDQQRRQQQFEEGLKAQGFNNEQIKSMWQADEQQNQQQFGNQMDQAAYQNQMRQAQMTEQMQQRGFSLNEINAIMSGQQVGMPGMPDFTNAQRSETPQYLDAADKGYQGALQQSSSENAGFNSLLSGAASLGSTAMMFSDRRLKTNIRRAGVTPGGLPLYTWTYAWGEAGYGVMADEAPAHAVHTHPSGFLMVDYSRIS